MAARTDHGRKPHRLRRFTISRNPQLVEKLEDIVGLYLAPPDLALVRSCDEKCRVQARDRTPPSRLLNKGRAQTMMHDYKRHGTRTLLAAFDVLGSTVASECQPRHPDAERPKFPRRIDRETPRDKTRHRVADHYAPHTHPKEPQWRAKPLRFHHHGTPASAPGLNRIEPLFRDLTSERLRRRVFTLVAELEATIHDHVAQHNAYPKPWIWPKSARHPAEGHLGQLAPTFQMERNATLAAAAASPPVSGQSTGPLYGLLLRQRR